VIAPAHAHAPALHVDHALHGAVVVRAGLRVGEDAHGARPDLLGAHAREVDRGGARHAFGLGNVGIELASVHHAHAVVLPARRIFVTMCHQSCSVSLWPGRHRSRRRSARVTAKSRTSAKAVSTRMPANTVLMSKAPSACW